jgi:hypothetical protein
MSRSLSNSQQVNQLSRVGSKNSIHSKENKDFNHHNQEINNPTNTGNTNSSVNKFPPMQMPTPTQKESGEFQISLSQLVQITETHSDLEHSRDTTEKKNQEESPIELDLNSLEFEALIRSTVKNPTPSRKNIHVRNFGNSVNLNFTEKKKMTAKKIYETSENTEKSENSDRAERSEKNIKENKLEFNFSQGNFQIPEDELRALFDNYVSQKRIIEESANKSYQESEVNISSISHRESNQGSNQLYQGTEEQSEKILKSQHIEQISIFNNSNKNNIERFTEKKILQRNCNQSYYEASSNQCNCQSSLKKSENTENFVKNEHYSNMISNNFNQQLNQNQISQSNNMSNMNNFGNLLNMGNFMNPMYPMSFSMFPIFGMMIEECKNFFSSMQEKFREEVQKLQMQNQNNFMNMNSMNMNPFLGMGNSLMPGEVTLYANNIKLVVNPNLPNSVEQNEINLVSTNTSNTSNLQNLSSNNLSSNINNKNNNKQNVVFSQNSVKPKKEKLPDILEIKDDEFDQVIRNIKSSGNKNIKNNLHDNNSFSQAKKNQNSNNQNINPFLKGKTTNNNISNMNSFPAVREEFDDTFDESKLNLKECKDEEFDSFFKNLKEKKVSWKDMGMGNDFKSGSGLVSLNQEKNSSILNSTTISSNNNNSVNNQVSNQQKKTFVPPTREPSSIPNNKNINNNINHMNNINNKLPSFTTNFSNNKKNSLDLDTNSSGDNIDPSKIQDDEFDSFLNLNKPKKKGPAKTFKPPTKLDKNNQNNSRNISILDKSSSTFKNEEVIESDFMCGNNKVCIKVPEDPKLKKLMEFMEQEYEDETTITEEPNADYKKFKNQENNVNNFQEKEKIKQNNKLAVPLHNNNASKPVAVPAQVSLNSNLSRFPVSNSKKHLSSSKKIKINEFSSEKLNSKRLFSDHLNSLDPEGKKNAVQNLNNNNNKKFKSTNQHFKYTDNLKNKTGSNLNLNNNKQTNLKINSQSQNVKNSEPPQIAKTSFFLTNIEGCEFYCFCIIENKNRCEICEGIGLVNKKNFIYAFSYFYKHKILNSLNFKLNKPQEEFLNYQFRLACWKYYILSKFSEENNNTLFSIENILKNVVEKFKIVFEQGKRSFLTKVAEKDASINKNMTLLLLDIKKTPNNENYILELTDGYKSVFSEILPTNPINHLISKNILIPGLKLNIGLAKIEKITDDFQIFLNIFYNSISKAESTAKLGVNKKEKFLIKNLANLREDGGEVSLIDVIILKKYDYYCYDFSKKEKFSSNKLEKLVEDYNDSLNKGYESYQEPEPEDDELGSKSRVRFNSERDGVKNLKKSKVAKLPKNNSNMNLQNKFPYENLTYVFKIVCVDSLLYLNSVNEINPEKNSNLIFKKSLKPKLAKKCVIEFSVKNKELYDNLVPDCRYQLGLLNISKTNQINRIYNDTKCLKLKANDNVLIKEIKLNKKETYHQRILLEIGQSVKVPVEDIDLTDYLINHSYNGSDLTQQEVTFTGAYLNHHYSKKGEDSNSQILYLFFANHNSNLTIIKIHDENFFDFSKILKAKPNSNPIMHFKNLNFQIVYYYESSSNNQLTTYKPEKIYDKNFNNKNIVFYLETSVFTSYKSGPSGSKSYFELNKAIKSSQNKIYDEALLQEVMKCI